MKVAKFGGTSLANAEQIKKVCSIILTDPERRLIVVSAPGKRFKEDIKVTDMLINCAKVRLAGGTAEKEAAAIIGRYTEIAADLGLSDSTIIEMIAADIRARLTADSSNADAFMDSLKAAGEDNAAKLTAAYLTSIGVEARYVDPREAGLLLSNEFGNAQVLPESYDNLANLASLPGISIFPGFFGYSKEGNVVTFSRGGSDVTGSILAAAINASEYENFTDVDSVFSANPNVIKNPMPITALTYREMRELSYAGFSVFHEEALVPVYRKGIPVRIKNTNNPSAPGTVISLRKNQSEWPVTGIACDTGFLCLYLGKYLMNREVGFGRRVLQILEEEGISYEHMPSGIDNLSIIIKEKQLPLGMEDKIMEKFRNELDVDDISIQRGLGLVMIVGEGMTHTVGIAARATRAFANAGVNLEMINQGSSEVSMMFGVLAEDGEKALLTLYEEFFR